MNVGSMRANSKGFKIAALKFIINFKASSGITLMHYILQVIKYKYDFRKYVIKIKKTCWYLQMT